MVKQISDNLGLILQIANLVVIAYGLYRFLHKPHDTLADEVKQLKEHQIAQDLAIKELNSSINGCFDRHREQEKTNAVFKHVFLLLANFEVAFCRHTGYEDTDDLVKAQDELQNYLAGK